MMIFFPKQKRIYTLFSDSSKELVKAADEFDVLLNDLPHSEEHARLIKSYERAADKVVNATFEYLHKTFITPFDHNDIQQLTIKLDDILDAMTGIALRIALYRFERLPPEIVSMGKLFINLAHLVDKNVSYLSSLKNIITILAICDEIGKLKSQAEGIIAQGVGDLFAVENDIKQLIKTKDIYERLKTLVDNFEDFSNVIKSITLEYA